MYGESPKNLRLNAEIVSKVNIINEVLASLKQPLIFENNDFQFNELSSEIYLHLNLNKLKNDSVSMEMRLSLYDFQIGIDRVSEVYEWSNEYIYSNRDEVSSLIKHLLSDYIIVEYCGSNYTSFTILNDRGKVIFKTPIVQGFYLKFNCKKREFKPIYSKIGSILVNND